MTPRTRGRHGAALAVFAFLVLAVFGGLAALQTATAPRAVAHDFLVKTIPAKSATVDRVPASVRLVFDQPAKKIGTKLVITGPDGPVQQGTPTLVDSQVRQSITPGAPAGHYTVSWRVTSADGHPVSGSFTFVAKHPAAGEPAASTNRSADAAKNTSAAKSTGAVKSTGGSDSVSSATLVLGGAGLVVVLVAVGWLIKRSAKK